MSEYIFKGSLCIVNEHGVVQNSIGAGSWVRCYDEPKYFKAHPNFPNLTDFTITDAFKSEAAKCK